MPLFLLLLSVLCLGPLPGVAAETPAGAATPANRTLDAVPDRVRRTARALEVPMEDVSIWVAPVDGAAPIVAWNADTPRMPASVMKLVTTFAALQGLSPTFAWRTEVYALGPVRGGVLDGDLLLRGRGDPYLVIEEFWKLLRGIRAAGIRRIEGDLVIDADYFDLPPEDPGAFDNRPDRVYNLPPHPLLVNFNAVRFEFMPQPNGVEVAATPTLPNLVLDNRLRLARRGCGGYNRGVALNVVDGAAERDRVMLEGRFPDACARYAMTRTVLRPEPYAYGLFEVLWNELGGEITGEWRTASIPAGVIPVDPETGIELPRESDALLHVHHSPPLGDLVRLVNKYSNNVMTRHLHLTLGAERFGAPATKTKGDEAVREVLERQGVDTRGLVIDNASGLTRAGRVTARQLGDLLSAAWRTPWMPEFVSSLAIAGLDGTVRGRYAGLPETGRMHLKTGTLDEVSAIAGYVHALDGRRYVVAVLVNSPLADRGPGREIQDALLYWLVRRDD